MQTAKIFNTGRSQAVRLPKSFEFDSKEVIIKHFGNGVLLLPKKRMRGLQCNRLLMSLSAISRCNEKNKMNNNEMKSYENQIDVGY